MKVSRFNRFAGHERAAHDQISGLAAADVLTTTDGIVLEGKVEKLAGGWYRVTTKDGEPGLAAVKAARALNIPVTGLDFIVPDTGSSDYVIIEANERPGLANHEPQPTAERFIDLLFPQTVPRSAST